METLSNLTFDEYFLLAYLIGLIFLAILWITSFILVISNDSIRLIKVYRIISFVLVPPLGIIYTIFRLFFWNMKKETESGKLKKRFQRSKNFFNTIFRGIINIFKWLLKK